MIRSRRIRSALPGAPRLPAASFSRRAAESPCGIPRRPAVGRRRTVGAGDATGARRLRPWHPTPRSNGRTTAGCARGPRRRLAVKRNGWSSENEWQTNYVLGMDTSLDDRSLGAARLIAVAHCDARLYLECITFLRRVKENMSFYCQAPVLSGSADRRIGSRAARWAQCRHLDDGRYPRPASFRNADSSSTLTPSFLALSSLLPAFSPATT